MQIAVCADPNIIQSWERLALSFDGVTPETCLSPVATRASRVQNQSNYRVAKTLYDWAINRNKAFRAQVLLPWRSQYLPSWLGGTGKLYRRWQGERQYNFTTVEREALARRMVCEPIEEFPRSIGFCVAHEAFNDGSGTLRPSLWNRQTLVNAFHWAFDSDPAAKLFYDDYLMPTSFTGLDGRSYSGRTKWRSIFQFVDEVRAVGGKFDGLGIQIHHWTDSNWEGIWDNLKWVVGEAILRDLEVHLSEISIWQAQQTTWECFLQGALYRETRKIGEELGATWFCFWSLTDNCYFALDKIRPCFDPAPFDRQGVPKWRLSL
jgi:GH35 family endo-1,4-beta-xylanase